MSKTGPLGSAARFADIIETLSAVIDARAGADPEASYTAKLLAKGPSGAAKKIIEEAGELGLALASEGDDAVASEAADLVYHLLVGLRARGVSLDDLAACLATREGVSGLAEKASRKS